MTDIAPDQAAASEEPSEHIAGVPDRTIVKSVGADGQEVHERVVEDKDEDGNVIGFHKENVEVA